MAQRRMFSPQIVDSDAFLEMPVSAQSLYFHLGMRADDDGFVGNPRKILRMIGGNEDDLKVLIAKRFLLIFESGVVVIKHWRIHNLIRHDRYHQTTYIEEKKGLEIKENGAYTEVGQPSGNHLATQVRLGKVRLGKDTEDSSVSYLSEIPDKDLKEFTNRFEVGVNGIKSKAEELANYCSMHGKRYKNYKSFLLNALKRDFKERTLKKEASPPPKVEVRTPEQQKEIETSLAKIRSSMTKI